MVSKFVGIGNL